MNIVFNIGNNIVATMKVLVVFVLTIFLNSAASLYCYWNTGCPYKYFSSKTPYNSVRGDIRDSIVKLTGCEPVSIWGVIRHGKRYPGVGFGRDMKEAIAIRNYIVSSYSKGHSSLCAQDIDNLRDWKVDNKLFERSHQLTEEGYLEMFGIGKRLKEAYQQLLDNSKDNDYTIRPTHNKWIKESAKGFVNGLGNNLKVENSKINDIIAPYATCGKYQKEVQRNPGIYAEADKYKTTSDYLAAKDRIQRRSGIEYVLTDVNITALYDLCRYTWSGIDSNISPWCALFTTDDLQVLEYIHDLKHYYRNAYGTEVNGKFAGVILEDLLKTFQAVKDGNGKKLTTYFTHSTMLDMMYMSLGLFKDSVPLTAANRDRDRKWRTSKNSILGANFVAVLNRCSKNRSDDYNVVFYLNEEPMISICAEGVCSWQEFEDKLKPFVNTTIDFCEFQSEPYK